MVTIEISCVKESVEIIIGENYLPTANHYDFIQEVFAATNRPSQLTIRPKNKNSVAIYASVRSFKQPAVFKIWGYCSSPSTKYGGNDQIDKSIYMLEQLVAPRVESVDPKDKSSIDGTNLLKKPLSVDMLSSSLGSLSLETNPKLKEFNESAWKSMSDDDNTMEDALVRLGLSSLRATSISSRGVAVHRNLHEQLFLNNK